MNPWTAFLILAGARGAESAACFYAAAALGAPRPRPLFVLLAAASGALCALLSSAWGSLLNVLAAAVLLCTGQHLPRHQAGLISFFVIMTAGLWTFLLREAAAAWPDLQPFAAPVVASAWLLACVLSSSMERGGTFLRGAGAAAGVLALPVFPLLWEYGPRDAENNLTDWMVLDIILVAAAIVSRLRSRYSLAQQLADTRAREIAERESQYRTLEETLRANAKLYHDMRHHLSALESALAAGETESARHYLEDLRTRHLPPAAGSTGNATLDGVIEAKLAPVRERLKTSVDCRLPASGAIRPADLVAAVGNLLDNAIQGALGSGEQDAFVDLTMRPVGGMLLIRTRNTCAADAKVPDPGPTPCGSHGWGLESVRDIAAQYDGALDVWREQNVYCAAASLRCSGTGGKKQEPPSA